MLAEKRPTLMRSILAAFLSMGLGACGFLDSGSSKLEAPPEGMVKIEAKGRKFLLGSKDSAAPKDQAPATSVSFLHDFWMDRHEVTVDQFRALRPAPSAGDSLPAIDSLSATEPRMPVRHISWFDALLYCNARSKQEKRDTVYAYERVEYAPGGSAIGMENLQARWAAAGYRLPTEAEWEFAALAGEEPPDPADRHAYAWSAENRTANPAEVMKLHPNAWGLFDMLGNVAEWVWDEKGPYPGGDLVEPLGPPGPGKGEDKPVRGGSFLLSAEQAHPKTRGSTYPAPPYAREAFIGFRCVLGAIHSGNPYPGTGVEAADARLLHAPATLPFLQAMRAKLVFVLPLGTQRKLAWVDYGVGKPEIRQFPGDSAVSCPAISPDGNWVAFSSSTEGARGNARVTVRRLEASAERDPPSALLPEATLPRWWVDTSRSDTFLVFTSSASANHLKEWRSEKTYRLRLSGGKPQGGKEILTDEGSFHGGLDAGAKTLLSGYTRLKVLDLGDRTHRTLFTGPMNGKEAGDTSQVCNVSLSPPALKIPEALFIDFGYRKPSALVGRAYGIHEVLFRTTLEGLPTRFYVAPPGKGYWNHPEWSTHPDYAVALTQPKDAGLQTLYALNLLDSAYLSLVEGKSLAFPHLWIPPGSRRDGEPAASDSLLAYDVPKGNYAQEILHSKLIDFWKRQEDLELVVLGSSHLHHAVDPSHFKGLRAYNLAGPQSGLDASFRLLEDYVLSHCGRLKHVLLEPSFFSLSRKQGVWGWSAGLGQSRGYHYDKDHDFWRNGIPAPLLEKAQGHSRHPKLDSLGFEGLPGQGWGASPLNNKQEWNEAYYRENLAYIGTLARLLALRKVRLTLVLPPESPAYRDSGLLGRYGPDLATGNRIVSELKAMETRHSNLALFDGHLAGNHDYGSEEAADWDHLSAGGAAKFSGRLAEFIAGLPAP